MLFSQDRFQLTQELTNILCRRLHQIDGEILREDDENFLLGVLIHHHDSIDYRILDLAYKSEKIHYLWKL